MMNKEILLLITLIFCVFAILLLPGLVFLTSFNKKVPKYMHFMLATTITILSCYISFWIFFYDAEWGKNVTLIFFSSIILYTIYNKKYIQVFNLIKSEEFIIPTVLMLGTIFFYLGFLYINGASAYPHNDAGHRFFSLANDNDLQFMLSQSIYNNLSPKESFLATGDWHSSDRPPLQGAVNLYSYSILRIFTEFYSMIYQVTSTFLQLLWIPAFYALCRFLKLSIKSTLMAFPFLIFNGLFFLNSVYVWPKLFSASLFISSYILLIGKPKVKIPFIFAVIMCSLALLSHSGIAFSILPLCFLLCLKKYYPTTKNVVIGVLLFLCMYSPWALYQKVYDPPANRLVKWHLAGSREIDSRGVGETLIDSYSNISFSDWIEGRVENLKTVCTLNIKTNVTVNKEKTFERMTSQFSYLGAALGPLNLIWVFCIYLFTLERKFEHKKIWFIVFSSIFLWVCIMFNTDSTTIHVGSYATYIMLYFVLINSIVSYNKKVIYLLFLFLHLLYFIVTWLMKFNINEIYTPSLTMMLIGLLTLYFPFSKFINNDKKSKNQKRNFNILLAIILIFSTIFLSEISLRIYNKINPSFIFPNDSYNRFRATPLTPDIGININSRGFKDLEHKIEKRKGVKRIVGLGDSFTFGVVPYHYNYLTLLEEHLNSKDTVFEVINMGISGTGVKDYYNLFINEGLKYKPDIVTVGFYIGNDFRVDEEIKDQKTFSFLYHLFNYYFKIYPKYNSKSYEIKVDSQQNNIKPYFNDEIPSFDSLEFLKIEKHYSWKYFPNNKNFNKNFPSRINYLIKLKDACDHIGAELHIILIPSEIQLNKELQNQIKKCISKKELLIYNYNLSEMNFKLPNELITKNLDSENIQYLDLLPIMKIHKNLYIPRNTHWNIKGNRVASKAIYKYFHEQFKN